jgi:biotin carboxyl carrier protein
MVFSIRNPLWGMAALLVVVSAAANPAWAQEVPTPPLITPTLDPPLPPGSADDISARMAARRAVQATGRGGAPIGPNAGTGGFPAGSVGGGFPAGFNGQGGFPYEGGLDSAQKKNAPVHVGNDPEKIENTDTIITQIIPLKNLDAVRLCNDLRPLLSADADVTANATSNCIVITDTSAKVRRIVEIAANLDKVGVVRQPTGGRGAAAVAGRPYEIRGFVQTSTAAIVVPVGGILEKVNVKEGEKVKAGQVLFECDARAEQAELQVALARLELAKAQLERSAVGAADAAVAKAALAAEQAQVELQRHKIETRKLKAPFDGTVTTLDVRAGQYVKQDTNLTQVVATSDLKVAFSLPLDDPQRVATGQKITFHVTASVNGFAGEEGGDYTAEVTYISPVASESNRTEIAARITGSTANLKPGLSGIVTFVKP